jgi:hypothetical protein
MENVWIFFWKKKQSGKNYKFRGMRMREEFKSGRKEEKGQAQKKSVSLSEEASAVASMASIPRGMRVRLENFHGYSLENKASEASVIQTKGVCRTNNHIFSEI